MLLSLATAVPPYVFQQEEALERARAIFAPRFPDFDRLGKVFQTSGVARRYSVRPLDWFGRAIGWPERTHAYLEGASELFVAAAGQALARAGLSAAAVDTVITVSSTGIATPSLEARVAGRMGFRADARRVPVFGLGCAGGVSGLALAGRLAVAEPGSIVLMVAIELCTLAFRHDALTKANIVATALFGDGAAAAVLRAGGEGVASVEASGEHLWPDTLGIMGWNVENEGLGVIFDRSIPPFAERYFGPAVGEFLDRAGLRRDDVDRFICHPGGAKVILALESALHLDQGSLDHERSVLADYGNMSAPTVLFVLERMLSAGLPRISVLTALGPGFTGAFLSLSAA